MVGILSPFMVAGLLMASPADFSFDGPEVTARTVGNVGFFTQGATPYSDLFERGSGTAVFSARERIADPRATYGDAGRLEATFTLGATTYRVELDQPGFPPAPRGSLTARPAPPAQSIAGGVILDQELHGGAALGSSSMTRVHAAAALWGVGRLWRNGQLLTDTALIHAAALSRGAHADDDTFRVLPVAREGDTELSVLVWNLPPELEPRGFVQFDFDDVAISVSGLEVPAVAAVPSAGSFSGVNEPSAPVPGGVFLGGVVSTAPGNTGSGTGGSGFLGAPQSTPQEQRSDVFQSTTGQVSLPTPTANRTDLAPAAPDSTRNNPNADPARASLSDVRPPPQLNGFVPQSPSAVSTQGSFSVVPLLPGTAGPGFAFGGDRLTGDLVATPNPLSSSTAPAPFIATPQPLNVQPPGSFVSTPTPLNSAPATPFIATPPPLSAVPR